jgi:hypothetical protein
MGDFWLPMALLVLTALPVRADPPVKDRGLVVHEWGTFTALQDENGDAIGGINSQDEPLPLWTHDIAGGLIIGQPVVVNGKPDKGVPHGHPDVTLRLETPVIYFHRRDSSKTPLVDVRARFRGGWLTQYYPDAITDAPGLNVREPGFGAITKDAVGELRWTRIKVGGMKVGPETRDNVWLAPRRVKADSVTTAKGETERFLFYRGVAHVDAPLRVSRTDDGTNLLIRPVGVAPGAIGRMWLVEVRGDGLAAQRPLEWLSDEVRTSASFPADGFRKESLETLRLSMRSALESQGLFPDEAAAVLDTWDLSYFKSPGLRLLFMVPRPWTDAVLPLEISVPAEITRTMVGRIEIVTPEQRALAKEAAALPSPDTEKADFARWNALYKKKTSLDERLGRFAEPLILDEAKRRPPAL